MSTITLFLADLTPEEKAVGFDVARVSHPDGVPASVLAVTHRWGDQSHRLVKTRGRDGGVVFQLQAFGRRLGGAGALGWHAERFWPGGYGPGWVLDRLREHVGRAGYRPLIELHIEPADDDPTAPPTPVVVAAEVS
jgi:hypothetical protein